MQLDWSLTQIYRDFGDTVWQNQLQTLRTDLESLSTIIGKYRTKRGKRALATWLYQALSVFDAVIDRFDTLHAFLQCSIEIGATDDPFLPQTINELDKAGILFVGLNADLINCVANIGPRRLEAIVAKTPTLLAYAFALGETLKLANFLMSADQEALVFDLVRTGNEAWSHLQASIINCMQHEANQESPATLEQLHRLVVSPKREQRQRAYERELQLLANRRISLAAALDSVKGTSLTLARWRGLTVLDRSLLQNRLSVDILEALLSAVKQILPDFRRYLWARAKVLGLGKLAWYDLSAPLPINLPRQKISREQILEEVSRAFSDFDPALASFARQAGAAGWINAGPNSNKYYGSSYCVDLPLLRQSLILCTLTDNLAAAAGLAHELGHAYHAAQLFDQPAFGRHCPTVLAETASLFCELIWHEHRLAQNESIVNLDNWLGDSMDVMVDAYVGYQFETAVFNERAYAELGADGYCRLMQDAQSEAYGDCLDQTSLHPYLWAVRKNYYCDDNFYNYPYSFGHLFAIGLYRHVRQDPAGQAQLYRQILQASTSASVESIGRLIDAQLDQPTFWEQSLAVIRTKIDRFEQLAAGYEQASSR